MAILLNSAPPPLGDPIARRKRPFYGPRDADPLEGLLGRAWEDYFLTRDQVISQGPTRLFLIELSAQSGSIGATDLTDGAISGGSYRLSYEARITQAAGALSSLDIEFDWTDEGVPQIHTAGSIVGNTTNTRQSETIILRSDPATPIRYTTTYASVGVPSMEYRLDIFLEAMTR